MKQTVWKYAKKEVLNRKYFFHVLFPALVTLLAAFSVFAIEQGRENYIEARKKISYLEGLDNELILNIVFAESLKPALEPHIENKKEITKQLVLNEMVLSLTKESCSTLSNYFDGSHYIAEEC